MPRPLPSTERGADRRPRSGRPWGRRRSARPRRERPGCHSPLPLRSLCSRFLRSWGRGGFQSFQRRRQRTSLLFHLGEERPGQAGGRARRAGPALVGARRRLPPSARAQVGEGLAEAPPRGARPHPRRPRASVAAGGGPAGGGAAALHPAPSRTAPRCAGRLRPRPLRRPGAASAARPRRREGGAPGAEAGRLRPPRRQQRARGRGGGGGAAQSRAAAAAADIRAASCRPGLGTRGRERRGRGREVEARRQPLLLRRPRRGHGLAAVPPLRPPSRRPAPPGGAQPAPLPLPAALAPRGAGGGGVSLSRFPSRSRQGEVRVVWGTRRAGGRGRRRHLSSWAVRGGPWGVHRSPSFHLYKVLKFWACLFLTCMCARLFMKEVYAW